MNTTSLAAIQLSQVYKRYKNFSAVEDLSFNVQPGEIFGLLGPNGAGKTTTLHMMCGLLPRSGGEISVLGFDPQRQAKQVRRLVGLVAQETNLYFDLTAVENLQHHAALYCDSLHGIEEKIEMQLKRMQLWERRNDAVGHFSGGMKRRLVLARALLHEPSIIIFDEPTLGVDVQARHVLWEFIREESRRGKTFLVSTNDMNEADALCDRLVILDHGKLIALDNPQALKNSLGRDVITLRTSPDFDPENGVLQNLGIQHFKKEKNGSLRLEVTNGEAIVPELINRISGNYHLESLQVSRPSLDDVFLHYTGHALRE